MDKMSIVTKLGMAAVMAATLSARPAFAEDGAKPKEGAITTNIAPPEAVAKRLKELKRGHALVSKRDGTVFEVSNIKIREQVTDRNVQGVPPIDLDFVGVRFRKGDFWFTRSIPIEDIQSMVFINPYAGQRVSYRAKCHVALRNGGAVLIEPKIGGPHRLAFLSADGAVTEEHVASRMTIESHKPAGNTEPFKHAHYGLPRFVGTAHVEGETAEWDGPMWIFLGDHVERIDFK